MINGSDYFPVSPSTSGPRGEEPHLDSLSPGLGSLGPGPGVGLTVPERSLRTWRGSVLPAPARPPVAAAPGPTTALPSLCHRATGRSWTGFWAHFAGLLWIMRSEIQPPAHSRLRAGTRATTGRGHCPGTGRSHARSQGERRTSTPTRSGARPRSEVTRADAVSYGVSPLPSSLP